MTKRSGKSDIGDNEISKRLRSYYNSVQDEEIPERFLDLLEKLDAAEAAAKSSGNSTKGAKR